MALLISLAIDFYDPKIGRSVDPCIQKSRAWKRTILACILQERDMILIEYNRSTTKPFG